MTLILAPNGELMTHWSTRDFDHPPHMEKTLIFIKNVMKFYRECGKEYLFAGKMSKSFDLECEKISIPLSRGRSIATLPRLLASSWECEDGKTAYIVVNPEEEALTFTIDGKQYVAPALDATLILI